MKTTIISLLVVLYFTTKTFSQSDTIVPNTISNFNFYNIKTKSNLDTLDYKQLNSIYLRILKVQNDVPHLQLQDDTLRMTYWATFGYNKIIDAKQSDSICTIVTPSYILMLQKNKAGQWLPVNLCRYDAQRLFAIDTIAPYGVREVSMPLRIMQQQGQPTIELIDPFTVILRGKKTTFKDRMAKLYPNGDIEIFEYKLKTNFVRPGLTPKGLPHIDYPSILTIEDKQP